MLLSDVVTVNGRFLRSVRIDSDNHSDALDGYVFTNSIREILSNFSRQQSETGQGAYTWTGPYGSGKSSLALVLSALLGGDNKERAKAAKKVDPEFAETLWVALPPKARGWKCVSVVGRRASASDVIADGLKKAGFAKRTKFDTDQKVIETLQKLAAEDKEEAGGLILFMDEMGKFLETAALTDGDAYFFQLLGEAASRSNGRLIVVGILHQSFQEYASKLAREIRDEWGKIQGRFLDIPINISGDEQIELVSRAIHQKTLPPSATESAQLAADLLRQVRPSASASLEAAFEAAWPLNPLVTLLLGPVSKRSYGQNQRSIFSFLGSSEQMGFRDYLENTLAEDAVTYSLSKFWDYLEYNLHSSIAVSLDSHHFTNARDAIARCQSQGGSDLQIDLLKSVALLELTQKQTGLGATKKALAVANNVTVKKAGAEIAKLEKQSILVFKKFRDVYALFDGSDFDIEQALDAAYREIPTVDISSISSALSVSTIAAKRHYHKTGSLRWCELKVMFTSQIPLEVPKFEATNNSFGVFILALNDDTSSAGFSEQFANSSVDLAIAVSDRSQNLIALAREKTALGSILADSSELQRDRIARREVSDRIEAVSVQIEKEVLQLVKGVDWQISADESRYLDWAGLNSLASEFADRRFDKSPKLRNELLNRTKPSGSANAALKQLLYASVQKEGLEDLGFEKYPAEKGLFESLILSNNLYAKVDGNWKFIEPEKSDRANLNFLWNATKNHLKKNASRNIQLVEIYNLWREEPYGVKDGLMPLLAVIFMLANRRNLSFYRDGIFLSSITDVDVDYILKAPQLVQLRWMDMNNSTRRLLSDLANVATELSGIPVADLSPLDVGRALIAAYESSAPWVKRTARLSAHAKNIRALFRRSNDPTKFTFDDIPALYAEEIDVTTEAGIAAVAINVKEGLNEILEAYPQMLSSMREQVLNELQVHGRSKKAYEELNARAKNIQGLTGELRLEAFINRLICFDGNWEDMEALAGLGINKPAKSWIDNDIDKALVQLTQFAQQFNQHEAVARVKGRKDLRSAMAMIISIDGRPTPIVGEFDVLENDNEAVENLSEQIENLLSSSRLGIPSNIILAALAQVGAARIKDLERSDSKHD